MIKITNIQAARTIAAAVLILLSGNAFAVNKTKPKTPPPPPAPAYATQAALNLEAAARVTGDAKLPSGNKIGDTLTWSGSVWTPETKLSTGFVLLDANGVVIGDYDFASSNVILEINSIYYSLPVTYSGFTDQQNIFAPEMATYFTTSDCTGTAYYRAIDHSRDPIPIGPKPFLNRETMPIVYGNKLYQQDPISIAAMSVSQPQGISCSGYSYVLNVVTPNSMIVIEDLGSIHPTPFSIKAN